MTAMMMMTMTTMTFLRGIGNMRRLSLKLPSRRYRAVVSLAGDVFVNCRKNIYLVDFKD